MVVSTGALGDDVGLGVMIAAEVVEVEAKMEVKTAEEVVVAKLVVGVPWGRWPPGRPTAALRERVRQRRMQPKQGSAIMMGWRLKIELYKRFRRNGPASPCDHLLYPLGRPPLRTQLATVVCNISPAWPMRHGCEPNMLPQIRNASTSPQGER